MVQYLRQGSAGFFVMGPFVQAADGHTEMTALSINKIDVRVMKNGAASVDCYADQGAADVGAPHDGHGMYRIAYDSGDTSAVGLLDFYVADATARITRERFMVLSQNAYDGLTGAGQLIVQTADVQGELASLLSIIASQTDRIPYEVPALSDIPTVGEISTAVGERTLPVPTQVPPEAATIDQVLGWLLAMATNAKIQHATGLNELKNRAGTTTIGSSVVTKDDDAATMTSTQ